MALRFDLSTIPENSYIESATLSLYSLEMTENDTLLDDYDHPTYKASGLKYIILGNNYKFIYPIEKRWNEDEASWNVVSAYPVYDLNYYKTGKVGYLNPDTAHENSIAFGGSREHELWENYNITDFVQSVNLGERQNNGFYFTMLRSDSIHWYGFSSKYASSEYDDIGLRPKLHIKYSSNKFLRIVDLNPKDSIFTSNFFTVNWHSNMTGSVKVELCRKGEVIAGFGETKIEDLSLTERMLQNIEDGSDYYLKLTTVGGDPVMDSTYEFSIFNVKFIAELPYINDFEESITDFSTDKYIYQFEEDDFNWTKYKGSTPSHSSPDDHWNATGPSSDHTTGQGYYLYTEASNNSKKNAVIMTPFMEIDENCELSFWYHMWAEQEAGWSNFMGSLRVSIYHEGKWSEIFYKKKSQGNEWLNEVISLAEYSGVVRFKFHGLTGDNHASDMAIDDIVVDAPTMIDNTINTAIKKTPIILINNGSLQINMDVPMGNKNFKVALYNPLGRKVLNKTFNENKFISKIDVSNISKGSYIIKISSNKYEWSSKILLAK